jgi:hypothetical protein
MNGDGVGFDREQHAPVASAQAHSDHAFERLHIARASFRECPQLEEVCAIGGRRLK